MTYDTVITAVGYLLLGKGFSVHIDAALQNKQANKLKTNKHTNKQINPANDFPGKNRGMEYLQEMEKWSPLCDVDEHSCSASLLFI